MSIDKIIVSILTLLGIFFTYWFFLMKKDTEVKATDSIDIQVKGGYSPSRISIPVNKKMTLNLIRKDPSECLEEFILPEFKIKKTLALHKTTSIVIEPKEKGEFEFSCGMNMFHGKIIVT